MASVIDVVKRKICLGCGTCVSSCPNKCISINELILNQRIFPKIEKSKCTECGICLSTCPQTHIIDKLHTINRIQFNESENQNRDIYVASTLFDHVRGECASGGTVTSIIISLFNSGLINGAMVTKLSDDGTRCKTVLEMDVTEIVKYSGSIYMHGPQNSNIRQIVNDSKGIYCFVGLPCQITGLRLMQQIYPELGKTIPYTISLFCSHNNSKQYSSLVSLFEGYHLGELMNQGVRKGRWPGEVELNDSNNNHHLMGYHDYMKWHAYWLCSNRGCLFCLDYIGLDSDVSCGDAWGIGNAENPSNILIINSAKGQDILRVSEKEGGLLSSPLEESEIHSIIKEIEQKATRGLARIRLVEGLMPGHYLTDLEIRSSYWIT